MKKIHLIANSHIDPMWLWEWEDGCSTAISTFRVAADFCEKYDGLVFNHNEAMLYEWVLNYEPELFARIQKLVIQGKWFISGGWYLQPDVNLPSGESIVRQIIEGYRFFNKYFGAFPKTALNLDSFGHSEGLIKILKAAGYQAYYICRPRAETGDMEIPDRFTWKAKNGDEILVIRDANGYGTGPLGTVDKIKTMTDRCGDENVMVMWGIGNHGGGISEKDFSEIRKYIETECPHEITHSTFDEYCSYYSKEAHNLPEVNLSLGNCMMGCYTSQIRIKQKHRELENLLFSVESMATSAYKQGLIANYPKDELTSALHDLLFVEFHDILPGSGVPGVEESALRICQHGIEILTRLRANCFFKFAGPEDKAQDKIYPIFVYNPHPYEIEQTVECEYTMAEQNCKPDWTEGVMMSGGKEVACQWEQQSSGLMIDWHKKVCFLAKLKPCALTRFDIAEKRIERRKEKYLMPEGKRIVFDNGSLKAVFDKESGYITSLIYGGKEYAKGKFFLPLMIDDTKDPWGMFYNAYGRERKEFAPADKGYVNALINTSFDNENMRIIEEGSVRTVIEAIYTCESSRIVMRYKLPKKGNWFDIEMAVLWSESDKLLKISLPLAFRGKAFTQTMFETCELEYNGNECPIQKYVYTVDGNSGLAIINDGIGGCDYVDGDLRLTALRSPSYSSAPVYELPLTREDAYVPRIDNGERTMRFRILMGRDVKESVERESELFNKKPYALCFFPSGQGKKSLPFIEVDGGLQCSAIKLSEDDDIIIRLYNPNEETARSRIKLLGNFAAETEIKGYSFETLRIKNGTAEEVSLFEKPL